MGNGITKNACFSGGPYAAAAVSDPPRDGSLGHSFTYVPSAAAFDHSPPLAAARSKSSFFSLSGAAISANLATAASMPSFHLFNELTWPPSSACIFKSSRLFAAAPLQAAPPRLSMSGTPQSMTGRFPETSSSASTFSGTLLDSPFLSGALDRPLSTFSERLQPSVPQLIAKRHAALSRHRSEQSFLGFFVRTATRLPFWSPRYVSWTDEPAEPARVSISDGDYRSPPNSNVEWAQGVAGEDRFHVAVSEEHGWVFVGIYDGFYGPDATDYLFANLYVAVHDELKGVLWDDIEGGDSARCSHRDLTPDDAEDLCVAQAAADCAESIPIRRRAERLLSCNGTAMHRDVLKALARALKKTEDAFFEAAEQRAAESPELGLMGSCVLVMLMKGADVYVMNVGDSRAVLARSPEPDLDILDKATQGQGLQRFKTDVKRELQAHDGYGLQAVQVTQEHSTAVEEEVRRIKTQHPNDRKAIFNGRVKGVITVTRAFGAGFLKQPKWNNRLLELFKINYVGTDPYITCTPSLRHHRIGPHDKFLVLSSDGLYQYFTDKEVVDQVESYTAQYPNGDPAKHLVSELVLRAASKAGMAPHELLDIPQGDRRRYHDDVSIIVISFEFKGRIWRSSSF